MQEDSHQVVATYISEGKCNIFERTHSGKEQLPPGTYYTVK